MIQDNRHHHLFSSLHDEELAIPSSGNRLYFHYSSYDEDDAIAPFDMLSSTSKKTEIEAKIALAAYEQAIQLAPNEPTLHYHKGLLLEQLGRSAEAAAAYEEAHRLGYQRTSEAKESSAIIDAEQSHS
jgi:tetratricopeptide (TPR) repeat protein